MTPRRKRSLFAMLVLVLTGIFFCCGTAHSQSFCDITYAEIAAAQQAYQAWVEGGMEGEFGTTEAFLTGLSSGITTAEEWQDFIETDYAQCFCSLWEYVDLIESENFDAFDELQIISDYEACILEVARITELSFTLTVDPVAVDEASGNVRVTVSTDGPTVLTNQTITLSLVGTATQGTDYTIAQQTLTLVEGETSVSTTVAIVDDRLIESSETIVVTGIIPRGELGTEVGSATITILDDDEAEFSLTVDAVNIVEDGGSAEVTVSTGGATFDTAQTITLSLAGVAIEGEDYGTVTKELTLAAGATSVSTTVTAIDDTVVEGNEALTITAQRGDTLVGETTLTITDNDTAQLTLTVDPETIAEAGGEATVTVDTGGATFDTAQTITLSLAGVAIEGEDYGTVTKELTLAAGATSVSTTVTAIDDTVVEGNEALTITAQRGDTLVGETTLTITDNDTAQLTLTVDPETIAEAGGEATVTVDTGGATFDTAQTITLSLAGVAIEGEDYGTVTKELTLAAGATSVSTTVTAIDDTVVEGNEALTITAQRGDTLVGETTLTITDNDTAQLTLTVDPETIAEAGGEATVTVDTGGATFDTAQTITLSLAGVAIEGEDYDTVTKELTLAAGATSVSTTVTAIDDTVVEGNEALTITAQRGDTLVGETTLTITDNDTAQLTLTVDPETIAEAGGEATVTVDTGGATFDTAQTITLSFAGEAIEGEDYDTVTKELTLAAGATSVSTTVTAIDDTVADSDETITITAQHGGEMIGEPKTITVMESETPPHEKEVVEETLEAVVSSALSNVTTNIGTRFSAARGGTAVTVAGLPVAIEDSMSALAAFNEHSDPELHGGDGDERWGQHLTLDRLLQTSAFQVSLAAADADAQGAGPGPSLTVWGRVDNMFFDKESGDSDRYDGNLKAGYLGIDTWLDDRWLIGVAASITKVDADYGLDTGGGKLGLSILGVHPYVRLALDDVSELWLILGLSRGKLQNLSKAKATPEDTDVTMYMGAAGVRRELTSIGGIDIALLGDAGFGSLRGGRGSGLQVIDNLSADAWRARLGFSGSHTIQLEDLATFTPFVEIVGRYDGGGDGNAGLEIAGGLQYANPVSGLGLEFRANVLPLYSENDYREYGFSLSASASPGVDGEGLAMAVTTSLGPQTGSTAALWRENLLGSANASDNLAESLTLNAEIGYGFPVAGSKSVLTPFGGFRLRNGGGQQMRAGMRFGQMVSARPWNLELSGEQRTSDARASEYLVSLLGRLRF